jgi:competence protein ComEC
MISRIACCFALVASCSAAPLTTLHLSAPASGPVRQVGTLEIHFIAVGQGDSTLIRCPGGEHILVDCGSSADIDAPAVRDYLLAHLEPDPVIDLLIVTHPDVDHYNLLPFVLEGVRVDHLAYAGDFEEYDAGRVLADGSRGEPVSGWLDGLAATRDSTRLREPDFDPLENESDLCDCGDASIFVLAADIPTSRSGSNFVKNARSIVVLVRHGDFEAMLTGDATFDTEEAILDRYGEDLEVEVLKLGHHGSRSTSSSTDWIRATSPEVAIASAALRNRYGHPSATVIRRAARYTGLTTGHFLRVWDGPDEPFNRTGYQESILCTGSNGNIVVTTDGTTYDVTWER